MSGLSHLDVWFFLHTGGTVKIKYVIGEFAFYNNVSSAKKYMLQTNAAVVFPLPLPQCLQQYVQLAIIEGGGAPITCPDMDCQKAGVLLDSEVCPTKNQWYVGQKWNQKKLHGAIKHKHSVNA